MKLSFLKTLLFALFFTVILKIDLYSQNINFKHYGIDEGIIHPAIYSINQDKNGFLWLSTGAGVCRFDGMKFSIPPTSDSISQTLANTSFLDRSGKVWFGYDDGSVYCFSNHKLRKIFKNSESPSVVNAFTETSDGIIIAATQNGGFYILGENKTQKITDGTKDRLYYSLVALSNNKFLAGTDNGLWVTSIDFQSGKVKNESKVPGIPNTKIQCIIPTAEQGSFWVGTEDAGFYFVKLLNQGDRSSVKNIGEKYKLSSYNIQWLLEDNQKNLWVCTFGNGVFKLLYSSEKKFYEGIINYNQENGLGDNFIKNAYQDKEGNIWIGTYSNGLAGIIDEAFVFYNFKTEGFNDVLSITSDKDNFWLGSHKYLIRVDTKNPMVRKIYSEKNGLPSDDITALHLTPDGTLWFGTEKNGLFKMDVRNEHISKFFSSSNSIENKINGIKELNNILWVATNGGVFEFNLKTGTSKHYSTDTDLPHNKINDIFIDSHGIVWIATKSNGLVSLNSDKHYKIEGSGELEFMAITEDKKGDLWAATYGDGIFEFRHDSLNFYTEKNGLKSDYCYSLITDAEGNIWVGHRLALSKINTDTRKIMTYGPEIGITGDCNPASAGIDPSGNLRFGTTDGLIQYNYQKNRQKLLPPTLNLISVKISDKEIEFGDRLELPYGLYRIRFDFVGLNYRAPSSVKYQYKLNGWESEWSELTQNSFAYYPRVEDGRFTFLLKAYNAEGICASEPLQFEIYVHPPFWKSWWFIILSISVIVALFYLYINYRERKQIQFQQYLQKMLDERTREVVEQKEVIEIKNRDITDSITYAQRIQASILPSIKRLQDTFSGCFIFYQPRDIVSGDFYWFDKISDNKFVIVCGDSTGHGVPGALMSMIGTTLIKDICNRPDVVNPSNILDKLDDEIRKTLNQNLESAGKMNDGMDLIACEIDTENYKVSIASAMRPVVLYKDGEQMYIPGSASSIGGNEYASEIKSFENRVYNLSKGDLVYMFSDGYPDQFGGPMGKKFKMVRLRNLLKDIHLLPMEEQFNHVKNTFNLWKDQLDQIDDVLFMGIKI